MSQPVTVRLDDGQVDRLQRLAEEYDTTVTEIVRMELGHERQHATALERNAQRLGDALAFLTIMMIGATFVYPLSIRLFVVVPLLASLTCYGVRRLLKEYEPAVSARLPWGDRA